MIFLVTQFPKPIITKHWEDLSPARPSGAGPASKGSLEIGLTATGGREGGQGDGVRPISPLNDPRAFHQPHVLY